MRRTLRVAAYAVVVRDGQLLLARARDDDGNPEWVLPGGGMEHGEDPYGTVRRELEEETGYLVEVTGFLGIDSSRRTLPRRFRRRVDHQGLRLLYEARIAGGELRDEVNGSTELAAWQPLDAVPALPRVGLIDTALRLWRERPAGGRLEADRE
ncbi:NUDIX domain-containing protein [Streptomyces thermocarboxydus]|uniref:NUDIX hydrolase n=1 Tax=Streptomyces cellulosae TaxID=1968 RepID=A0ABW6JNT4_STRCE|nr:NUDIX domain-containing protein [Streptomyces thermocarboxydus]